MPAHKQPKAPPVMAEADIAIVRIAPETSFKNKAYEALKEAILKMDIYATPEQVMLDERALSERLGVSRTPIREAIAMLEQDGFVKTVRRMVKDLAPDLGAVDWPETGDAAESEDPLRVSDSDLLEESSPRISARAQPHRVGGIDELFVRAAKGVRSAEIR